jgi:hypothetical protein
MSSSSSKRLDRIQIVLGEGVHNVRCDLVPTRNARRTSATRWDARSSTSAAATT